MDSVFEKITLYDLFAYFVPGFVSKRFFASRKK